MTDPSKQRLIDVLVDMWVRERAKVLFLTEDMGDDWDAHPHTQAVLMKFEEIARRGVPNPMRNHPTAEELRMSGDDMMPTNDTQELP